MKKIIFLLVVTCFLAVSCKQESKKTDKPVKTEVSAKNIEATTFAISGMTCEIGCAKHIASKLSKIDGVVEAEVVFADSIANVKFDKTKTDAKKLMAYVDGMANNTYKTSATEVSKVKCKCEGCEDKKVCSESCKKECNSKKKTACKEDCKKDCSSKKMAACKQDCKKKKCCTDKKA